jgi:hypothetical protein
VSGILQEVGPELKVSIQSPRAYRKRSSTCAQEAASHQIILHLASHIACRQELVVSDLDRELLQCGHKPTGGLIVDHATHVFT